MPYSSVSFSADNGTISVTGKTNIAQKLSSYSRKIDGIIDKALLFTGGKLQEMSVDLTPIDTGELRSRAFTSDVFEDKDGKTVVVGYEKEGQSFPILAEGSTNKYSVYVHEIDRHHEVGQSKFLETAAKQFDTDFYTAVAKLIKKGKP